MALLLPDDPGAEIAGLLASDWAAETYGASEELVSISLRVSPSRLAVLDAMAKKTGFSRNRMANMLLAIGCRDVIGRLPPEVVADLHEATGGEGVF